MKRLSELAPGTGGTVAQLAASPRLTRLREMGLVAGTRVQVVRRAPLGDPLEIQVRGSLLSVRREDADLILVEPAS